MKKLLAVMVIAIAATGCAQQTFTVQQDSAIAPKQVTTQHFFVAGIGQKKTIDAAALCGGADKIARVEVQQTFVNGLLNFVTFGIYSPREARVYCS